MVYGWGLPSRAVSALSYHHSSRGTICAMAGRTQQLSLMVDGLCHGCKQKWGSFQASNALGFGLARVEIPRTGDVDTPHELVKQAFQALQAARQRRGKMWQAFSSFSAVFQQFLSSFSAVFSTVSASQRRSGLELYKCWFCVLRALFCCLIPTFESRQTRGGRSSEAPFPSSEKCDQL